jgi:hypothetical protein
MARKFMEDNAASKALNKLIRQVYSLQQKYPASELAKKPFIVPVLVDHLDVNDPDVKRRLLDQKIGPARALYGPDPRAPESAKAVDATIVDQETGEEIREDDFEFDPPTEAAKTELPKVQTCECVCQHGGQPLALSPQVAEMTRDKVGAALCATCFPGKAFNFEAHRHLERLGLPKFPNLTPHEVFVRNGSKSAGGGR